MKDSTGVEFNQRRVSRNVTLIDEGTIEKIAKTRVFDKDELNNKLYQFHKKLLFTAKNKNKSNEVGILWNILTDEYVIVMGTENGINICSSQRMASMLNTGYSNSLVFMHNHPRNSGFSYIDLNSFCEYNAIVVMTAVCNDGRIHAMRKEIGFNPDIVSLEYNKYVQKNMSGMSNIIKNAPKLRLFYKCSVARKSS